MSQTIDLEAKCCGFVRIENNFYIALVNKKVHCYSVKGIKNFTLNFNSNITCIEVVDYGKGKTVKVLINLVRLKNILIFFQ